MRPVLPYLCLYLFGVFGCYPPMIIVATRDELPLRQAFFSSLLWPLFWGTAIIGGILRCTKELRSFAQFHIFK